MKGTLIALIIAAAGLSACGGSSNERVDPPAAPPPTATNVVPPTATASIQAFVAFLAGLLLSERDLPLNIDAAVPPTSETAAPLPLT